MSDRETSMRPTPSDAAILQSTSLGPRLAPPQLARNIDPPVAYIAIDVAGRDIITVEGPVELERDHRGEDEDLDVYDVCDGLEEAHSGVHRRADLPLPAFEEAL